MRIDGYSADRIADELNRLGILSPRQYKKDRNIPLPKNGYCDRENSKWSATTILRILKDEVYTGKLIQGKQGTPNTAFNSFTFNVRLSLSDTYSSYTSLW